MYPRMVLDYGFRDIASLLLPAGSESADLQSIGAHLASDRHFAVAFSVRTAFDILLTCLGPAGGGEIVLSAVTVPGMAAIARHHGYRVRAADVDPDTLEVDADEVERLIGERTRMVVIAPLFGTALDLRPVAERCRKHGVLLVEDAAQAWSGTYRGSDEADIVMFSFGPAKAATALGGAVVLFRDGALAADFREREQALPEKPRSWLYKRTAKYGSFIVLRTPLGVGVVVSLLQALGVDADRFIGSLTKGFVGPNLIDAICFRLSPGVRHLMANRLATHPGTAARAARGQRFFSLLAKPVRAPGRSAAGHGHWLTGVCVDDRDELVRDLRARGYDASCGASSLVAIEDDDGYRPGAAAKMMDTLVYMPLTRYTGDREIAEMAELVNAHCSRRSAAAN